MGPNTQKIFMALVVAISAAMRNTRETRRSQNFAPRPKSLPHRFAAKDGMRVKFLLCHL
jgi:hypothetical protein